MDSDKRKFTDEEKQAPIKKRVMGPSLPPPPSNADDSSQSDDESDDDFGPSLPPPQGASASPAPIEQPKHQHEPLASDAEKNKARDDWMLAPPAPGDWASKVNPTQLRNRKFQGKPSGSGSSKQIDASWVESPEERLRRLGDQVMGVSTPSETKHPAKSSSDATRASMEKKIKQFNDQTGKRSRLESQSQTRKDEDDDPSSRAFDREKDMAISSKISSAQRREMVSSGWPTNNHRYVYPDLSEEAIGILKEVK